MEYFVFEVYCAGCQDWRETPMATTRENFESDPFLGGGLRVILSCSHVISGDDYESRLGRSLGEPPGPAGQGSDVTRT